MNNRLGKVKGGSGGDLSQVQCFQCFRLGHMARNCYSKRKIGGTEFTKEDEAKDKI